MPDKEKPEPTSDTPRESKKESQSGWNCVPPMVLGAKSVLSMPIPNSFLDETQRHLVKLIQWIDFGRVENLHVRSGVPVSDPPPRFIRTLKMGAENGPRRETVLPDFFLKRETIDMLRAIADLGDGIVLKIDVQHGLPFSLEIEFSVETSTEAGEHDD